MTFATLTLRLVGQAGPTVISKANDVATITGQVPQKGFLSGVFAWTASVVQLFDREQREQVSASIRGNLGSQTGSQLSAPLLARPQTVLAGKRKLTIGWVSPLIVEIRILDGNGRPIASGRGSGTHGPLPKSTGSRATYTIELAASGETLRQSLHFVPPDKGPNLPPRSAIRAAPESLRAVATARGTRRRIRRSARSAATRSAGQRVRHGPPGCSLSFHRGQAAAAADSLASVAFTRRDLWLLLPLGGGPRRGLT